MGYQSSRSLKTVSLINRLPQLRDDAFYLSRFEELYRIDQDPFEENNLAALPEYAEKLAALREMVSKRMVEVGDDKSLSGPPRLLENFSILESSNK